MRKTYSPAVLRSATQVPEHSPGKSISNTYTFEDYGKKSHQLQTGRSGQTCRQTIGGEQAGRRKKGACPRHPGETRGRDEARREIAPAEGSGFHNR